MTGAITPPLTLLIEAPGGMSLHLSPLVHFAEGGGGTYDDTELRGRIETLEDAPPPHQHDAADIDGLPAPYDDSELQGRITALEEAPPSALYDDSELRGRVEDVEGAVAALPDPYDDTALAGRVGALELAPPAHQHEISDVAGLQSALDDIETTPGDAGASAQILAFDHDDESGFDAAVAASAGNPLVLVVRYAEP